MTTNVNRTGNVYVNPVTRERAAVLLSAVDTRRELIRAEMWTPPGGRVAFPHTHPHQSERFEVLEGRLGVRQGDDVSTAVAGDSITIPAGTMHDWWAEGDEPARVLTRSGPLAGSKKRS